MGDFINTQGPGSNPENLVWRDEVTIDKKEGQRTFTYGSNSGLRRLSEEVPWAWKRRGQGKETRKTSFGHCRNYKSAQIDLGRRGGHPQIGQRTMQNGISSLILHERCFSLLTEQSSKSSLEYLGREAT